MPDPCKTCQSTDFVTENHERVCTNCGDVLEELSAAGHLLAIPNNEAKVDSLRNKTYEASQRLTSRIRNETNCATVRKRINRDKVVDDMRNVVKKFIKHPAAVGETMELVESTLKAFKGRLLESRKLGLVGACIYYVSAKHQLGISLHDICKAVGLKMKVMGICLKSVRELCPDFEYERTSIRDLVSKYIDQVASKHYDLNSFDISSNQKSDTSARLSEPVPLISAKDRTVIQNRVLLLIDLFEAMHPYNQPSPQSLIVAVIFHAWKSLDTFKTIAINLGSNAPAIKGKLTLDTSQIANDDQNPSSRTLTAKHLISYEKFCHISDLRYSSNGYRIVSKLQRSLLMLGKYLGDVNKINLPWFLKDIIENSAHLLQEYMRAGTTAITNDGHDDTLKSV